jgi:hypothetical protein
MPDRFGEPPDDDPRPVVDFDSRRQARQDAAAAERAAQQRARLAETRAVHAPLNRHQADAARAHRTTAATHAETHRNALRIANCGLCDADGYRGAIVCDHIDRSAVVARGMAKVRAALTKPKEPS